jgi:hypothetical protein
MKFQGGYPLKFHLLRFIFFGRLGQPVDFQDFSIIRSYYFDIVIDTGSQIVCDSSTSTKSIGRSSLSFAQ